jgi:hypothetical protein
MKTRALCWFCFGITSTIFPIVTIFRALNPQSDTWFVYASSAIITFTATAILAVWMWVQSRKIKALKTNHFILFIDGIIYFLALSFLSLILIMAFISSVDTSPVTIALGSMIQLLNIYAATAFAIEMIREKTPNQAPQTTTMAVTPAASHPSRQPWSRLT